MIYTEKTNAFGQVVLKEIPIDVYEVLIEETNDFMAEKKVYNYNHKD